MIYTCLIFFLDDLCEVDIPWPKIPIVYNIWTEYRLLVNRMIEEFLFPLNGPKIRLFRFRKFDSTYQMAVYSRMEGGFDGSKWVSPMSYALYTEQPRDVDAMRANKEE